MRNPMRRYGRPRGHICPQDLPAKTNPSKHAKHPFSPQRRIGTSTCEPGVARAAEEQNTRDKHTAHAHNKNQNPKTRHTIPTICPPCASSTPSGPPTLATSLASWAGPPSHRRQNHAHRDPAPDAGLPWQHRHGNRRGTHRRHPVHRLEPGSLTLDQYGVFNRQRIPGPAPPVLPTTCKPSTTACGSGCPATACKRPRNRSAPTSPCCATSTPPRPRKQPRIADLALHRMVLVASESRQDGSRYRVVAQSRPQPHPQPAD